MKRFGPILIFIGICFGIYALSMETSVRTNYAEGNPYGLPERVNNLGLMNDKQNYLIVAGFLIISGILLSKYEAQPSASKTSEQIFREQKEKEEREDKLIGCGIVIIVLAIIISLIRECNS